MPSRDGKFVPVVAVSYTGTGVHSRQLAVRKLVSRRAEQKVAVSHSETGVEFFRDKKRGNLSAPPDVLPFVTFVIGIL